MNIIPRRVLPSNFMESDEDYIENNLEAVIELLDTYHSDIEPKVKDYPHLLAVVLRAWDVIDHRADDYLDNKIAPYSGLLDALKRLGK